MSLRSFYLKKAPYNFCLVNQEPFQISGTPLEYFMTIQRCMQVELKSFNFQTKQALILSCPGNNHFELDKNIFSIYKKILTSYLSPNDISFLRLIQVLSEKRFKSENSHLSLQEFDVLITGACNFQECQLRADLGWEGNTHRWHNTK